MKNMTTGIKYELMLRKLSKKGGSPRPPLCNGTGFDSVSPPRMCVWLHTAIKLSDEARMPNIPPDYASRPVLFQNQSRTN